MSNVTNKLFVDKMGGRSAEEYVGVQGELFYDPADGHLRLSDGATAGGTFVNTQATTTIDSFGNLIVADNSTSEINIGPGETHQVPNMSGLILVNDHYDGGIEMWLVGSGNGTEMLVSATRPQNVGTMQADYSVNGYSWTNTANLNGPFTFTVVKTRNGA